MNQTKNDIDQKILDLYLFPILACFFCDMKN